MLTYSPLLFADIPADASYTAIWDALTRRALAMEGMLVKTFRNLWKVKAALQGLRLYGKHQPYHALNARDANKCVSH